MTTTSREAVGWWMHTAAPSVAQYNEGGLYGRNRWEAGCLINYSSVLVAIITIINNQHPGTAAERISLCSDEVVDGEMRLVESGYIVLE